MLGSSSHDSSMSLTKSEEMDLANLLDLPQIALDPDYQQTIEFFKKYYARLESDAQMQMLQKTLLPKLETIPVSQSSYFDLFELSLCAFSTILLSNPTANPEELSSLYGSMLDRAKARIEECPEAVGGLLKLSKSHKSDSTMVLWSWRLILKLLARNIHAASLSKEVCPAFYSQFRDYIVGQNSVADLASSSCQLLLVLSKLFVKDPRVADEPEDLVGFIVFVTTLYNVQLEDLIARLDLSLIGLLHAAISHKHADSVCQAVSRHSTASHIVIQRIRADEAVLQRKPGLKRFIDSMPQTGQFIHGTFTTTSPNVHTVEGILACFSGQVQPPNGQVLLRLIRLGSLVSLNRQRNQFIRLAIRAILRSTSLESSIIGNLNLFEKVYLGSVLAFSQSSQAIAKFGREILRTCMNLWQRLCDSQPNDRLLDLILAAIDNLLRERIMESYEQLEIIYGLLKRTNSQINCRLIGSILSLDPTVEMINMPSSYEYWRLFGLLPFLNATVSADQLRRVFLKGPSISTSPSAQMARLYSLEMHARFNNDLSLFEEPTVAAMQSELLDFCQRKCNTRTEKIYEDLDKRPISIQPISLDSFKRTVTVAPKSHDLSEIMRACQRALASGIDPKQLLLHIESAIQ